MPTKDSADEVITESEKEMDMVVDSNLEENVKNIDEETKTDEEVITENDAINNVVESSNNKDLKTSSNENSDVKTTDKTQESTDSDSDASKTPGSRKGRVRTTSYGTPVMNIASSYTKLPTDVNFAKDICDVINFENLPNSTGKYKQISTLLKKVKSEVDRIQES